MKINICGYSGDADQKRLTKETKSYIIEVYFNLKYYFWSDK